MKLSSFRQALDRHDGKNLAFILPGGDAVPSHAHITEVGRMQKTFVDCGGKLRDLAFASLQIWVADDTDHRLPAGKLAAIIDKAGDVLGSGDLEMQIECQAGSISLFSVEGFEATKDTIAFTLANKQTACLAMEICLPDETGEEKCCGSGCCS